MATQSAANWWASHPADPSWIAHYRATEGRVYRQWIIEALGSLSFGSVYEIGCHCGPMLAVIQRAFQGVTLHGCDVNREAVEAAQARGFSVTEGVFPAATAGWPDQSVDVVLSCYALAYVGRDEIEAALVEAGRIARKAVVICEPVAWDLDQAGEWREGQFTEYRHPYLPLLMRSEFVGWKAYCQEVSDGLTRLSGLLVVTRP